MPNACAYCHAFRIFFFHVALNILFFFLQSACQNAVAFLSRVFREKKKEPLRDYLRAPRKKMLPKKKWAFSPLFFWRRIFFSARKISRKSFKRQLLQEIFVARVAALKNKDPHHPRPLPPKKTPKTRQNPKS
jgi:hypothetical protein